MVFRCTPLTVEPSSVVKTLEALACCGVTVTGGPGVCVVITVALATLAILFLCKPKTKLNDALGQNSQRVYNGKQELIT